MNGSEKQVRWAEDIKKRLLEDGAKRLEDFENLVIAYRTEDYNLRVQAARDVIAAIEGKQDAAWFINNGNERNFHSLWRKRFQSLKS